MRLRVVALLLAAVAAGGCALTTAQPHADIPILTANERVVVHLRRDALGVAASAPTGLNPDGQYRADYVVTGRFIALHDGWMVIEHKNGSVLFPVEQILAVEVPAEAGD